jgi:hypothetical protein
MSMFKSSVVLVLVCAGVVSAQAQHWAPAPNWMPMPPMAPLFPETPALAPMQPPPAIVYPAPVGPRACEQVCRPTRDGGYRCGTVCYGG